MPAASDILKDAAGTAVDLRDWANVVLCDRVFADIRDYELKQAYDGSFLSEICPGVALSMNTVSKFLSDLGKTCFGISRFMKNRTDRVNMDHHLLVESALKSDESKVNSISDFSRKARTKARAV